MDPEAEIPAPSPSPVAGPATFREVRWRLGDVLIGLVVLCVLTEAPRLIGPATWASVPRRAWVLLTAIGLGGMFAYPLAVARRRSGFRPARPGVRRLAIEALLPPPALLVALLIAAGLTPVLARLLGEAAPYPRGWEPVMTSPDPFAPIALAVLAIAFAPVAEEVFFRGMLYNALRSRLGPAPAAILQAVAFGLYHPFGAAERVIIAALGLCLAGLYEWRKTLVAPILLHASINLVAMAMMFATIAAAANAPVLGVQGSDDPAGCRVVVAVPGSPAEHAGLRPGDIITQAGEYSVRDFRDLVRVVRLKKVGDKIPVVYLRDGETYQVEATLARRPK